MKATNLIFAISLTVVLSLPFGKGWGWAQNIGINTTGAAPAATNMLEVLQPSTTASSVGIYSNHTGAIAAGTGYAFQALKSGASLNNIAAYLSASGATNNYALIVPSGGGFVGIGTITPLTSMDVNGAYSARSSTAPAAAAVVIPNNVSLFRLTLVALVQANALSVAAAQEGQFLTIVNIDDDPATFGGATIPATNGVGAFVFEGTAWRVISIATGAAGWTLAGNSLVGTEFTGSTNAQPFIIRTNNTERARILSGGAFLINRTTALFATDAFEVQGNVTFPDPITASTDQAAGIGVFGENTVANGIAMQGEAPEALSAGTRGYIGLVVNGIGVSGQASGATGWGVRGIATNATGTGIRAQNSAVAGAAVGFAIDASSEQTGGAAIVANLQAASFSAGTAISAFTAATIAGGTGITAACNNATGTGVVGQTSGAGISTGVSGFNTGAHIRAIGVYGNASSATAGTGFSDNTTRRSIYGQANNVAGSFRFGVYGDGGIAIRTGGVIGVNDDGAAGFYSAGALGYFTSGSVNVAGYGFGATFITGVAGGMIHDPSTELYASRKGIFQKNKIVLNSMDDEVNFASWSNQEPNNMIGLGIYGGVMGGWIKGLVYGANLSGAKYGVYVHGKTITNNIIISLNNVDNSEKRVPTYAPSAMKVDVTDRGKAKLINGKVTIEFDKNFAQLISPEEPVTITVTPFGTSKGLYIEKIFNNGFSIVENDGGNSNVEFNWIAIGVKKGFEKPFISSEILSDDFEEKINGNYGVMFNDNNPETPLYSLWYDGKQVRFDKPPVSNRKIAASYQTPHVINERENKNSLKSEEKRRVKK